jgi:HSP20 family protein
VAKKAGQVPVKASSEVTKHPWLDLRREVDEVFDRFSRGWGTPRWPAWDMFKDFDVPFARASSLPQVDVSETNSAYEVSAELPGVEEKDMDVSISDGMLVIKGEKRDEREKKAKDYHLTERSYGEFRRSFRVPDNVEPDKITASFSKGVLKVSLPKSKKTTSKERSIPVKDA